MAEQLGEAVLKVKVDSTQLQAGLDAARQKAVATGNAIEQAFSKSGRPLQTANNGLQYFIDAQGRARDAAGKFLTVAELQAAGLTKLGGAATQATGGLGGLGAALGGAGVAVGVAAAAAAAIVGIGAAAVQSAGQIQKLNAAFTGLTGSAEAAKQLRQDLFTLSKTTPFKNEEILTAAQRFLAVGVNVSKLQGTINRVGAIAAQSGQSLDRLALIYAQVYAKGRLQGEENLQLLEAGVDLSQELTKVTGLSGKALQDAMSKGQIGIKDFNAALALATGDMTALQQAGKAVDVQFNNIGDNLGQLFGGFALAISPAISAAFKVINDAFDQMFPSLDAVEQFFKPLTNAAQNFAKALADNPAVISVIAGGLKNLGELVIKNIAFGLQTVANILKGIDQEKFVKGFITAELVLRRMALAASALGATLVKNAELAARGVLNPRQFVTDIAKAGGIGAFMEKEYKDVGKRWNEWANSKPLEFPKIQTAQESGQIAGELDNKQVQNADQIAKAYADMTEATRQRLADARALAGLEGIALDAMKQQLTIDKLRRDERKAIDAYDKALMAAGFDRNNPEVSKAAGDLANAGNEIKIALIEGSQALRKASEDAAKRYVDAAQQLVTAQLALSGAQANPQGLSRFLAPQDQQQRLQSAILQLGPALESALKDARSIFNAQGVGLGFDPFLQIRQIFENAQTGAYIGQDSLQAISQFINDVNAERNAIRGVNDAQKSVNEINQELANVNGSLRDQVYELVRKNWEVQVNVNGAEASIYGDAVNRSLS